MYKMRIAISLLLFCFISFKSESQVLEITQTTYTQHNFSTGMSYTNPFKKFTFREKGQRSFRKTGLFGDKIKPYFEENEEALSELQKYKSKRVAATLSGVGAIATFVTFAAINLSDTELKAPEESGPKATGLIGLMAGFALIDFIFAASSNQHMVNAVNMHNSKQNGKVGFNIDMIRINQFTSKNQITIGAGFRIRL